MGDPEVVLRLTVPECAALVTLVKIAGDITDHGSVSEFFIRFYDAIPEGAITGLDAKFAAAIEQCDALKKFVRDRMASLRAGVLAAKEGGRQ